MQLERADIIRSLNGRDKGRLFIVYDVEPDFIYLVDGKRRRTETPKRKKSKHVELVGRCDDQFVERITTGDKISNGDVRKVLAQFSSGNTDLS